jgi:2-hydroxychromene-2-carboxylate isomerase
MPADGGEGTIAAPPLTEVTMTAPIDLYFSFRSPYSYLAVQFVPDIEAAYDVSVALRPVLPLALRDPGFFRAANEDRVRYILLDYPRRAEMLGLPYGFPQPDPIVQDMETLSIAEDQPYIYRLTHLGVEAQRRGRGIAFAKAVSRLIWSGTAGWDQGDHLARAAQEAGLVLADMDAAIASQGTHAAEVEANQVAQKAAGHTGVPLFVYNDEPFFGQDRIYTLAWRLAKDGLKR